ncbi:MAG: glycosyltransferase family 4 protein [Candidatus Limnocylindria bacterium]
MNILFVKRGYAPVGGSESLAYQFATRLAARGHDVRVVCAWPSETERTRRRIERFSPRVFDDHRVFVERGVEVVQVKPRGGLLGLAADATTLVDLMRGHILERYAQDRDIVHNVGREYLDSSVDVAEELEIPLVLTPLAHPGQFHGGDSPADMARYRHAAAITTMTEWERGWYADRGIEPSRIVVTGMGPNAVRSREGAAFRSVWGIPADAPVVLYIGRKERYKGYIQLLDAAELVWREHPETRFVFIGIQGFYSTFIDDFARYADERIIDIENAPGATKSAALDACDVFAMPSIHETFGLGYIEAWLHERPVIGGDIPPLREVITDGVDGLLVRQRPTEVAAVLLRLLADPALREAMGRAGRAKVEERWDWERVIDRVEMAHKVAADLAKPVEDLAALA